MSASQPNYLPTYLPMTERMNAVGASPKTLYFAKLHHRQCDHVTRLCFQYLAIYINENLPKSIQIEPK